MQHRRKLTAWTDGACKGNPGYGGWAVHLDGHIYKGSVPHATNNLMEIMAAYMAVEYCPTGVALEIVTDSQLVQGWLKLGWAIRQPHILNVVKQIFRLLQEKDIALSVRVVKGHAQDDINNYVDRIASLEASKCRQEATRLGL